MSVMAQPVADPNECSTAEAWAELVRSERQSAIGMIEALARARAENARLRAENERLLAALSGRAAQSDTGA